MSQTKTLHHPQLRRRPQEAPELQLGERILFDGVEHEVVRVTPCAAYIRSGRVRQVVVEDPKTGLSRSFEAHESRTVAISARSIVERIR